MIVKGQQAIILPDPNLMQKLAYSVAPKCYPRQYPRPLRLQATYLSSLSIITSTGSLISAPFPSAPASSLILASLLPSFVRSKRRGFYPNIKTIAATTTTIDCRRGYLCLYDQLSLSLLPYIAATRVCVRFSFAAAATRNRRSFAGGGQGGHLRY
jgi:hypothetical protein